MSQVTITLNGRTYRLSCGEGEESRLIELADVVRTRLQSLVAEFGQAGDDRLLLMSALLIADELLDARSRLAALHVRPDGPRLDAPRPDAPRPDDTRLAETTLPSAEPPSAQARPAPARGTRLDRARPGHAGPAHEPPPLPVARPAE